MNGDDGYVDAGGGGSVWCEFHISETSDVPGLAPVTPGPGHRPRKDGHQGYLTTTDGKLIVDKYTEHKPGDLIGGQPLPPNHPHIVNQGEGFFVLTIDNARQLERIEITPDDTVRLYVRIDNNAPFAEHVRQVGLRWGLRRNITAGLSWAAVKQALLGTGAVNTANAASVEGLKKENQVT